MRIVNATWTRCVSRLMAGNTGIHKLAAIWAGLYTAAPDKLCMLGQGAGCAGYLPRAASPKYQYLFHLEQINLRRITHS